jgi:hypothetical protein
MAATAASAGHRRHRTGEAASPLPPRGLIRSADSGLCSHEHKRKGFRLVGTGSGPVRPRISLRCSSRTANRDDPAFLSDPEGAIRLDCVRLDTS